MTKLVLKFDEWLARDQNAWLTAIREGDILDGCGPATHWRETTRRINIEHYGRWLSFLIRSNRLEPGSTPHERVTQSNIRAFITELQSRVAPCTTVGALVGLKVTIKAMAPDQSWLWLETSVNRLNVRANSSKDKRPKMRPTPEIVAYALKELDRLSATALSRRIERVAYRDALMIGLMALRPLRLGNFTSLDIGNRLIRNDGTWQIEIPGSETKKWRSPFLRCSRHHSTLSRGIHFACPRSVHFNGTRSDECIVAWLRRSPLCLPFHSLSFRICHRALVRRRD